MAYASSIIVLGVDENRSEIGDAFVDTVVTDRRLLLIKVVCSSVSLVI